MVNTQTTSIAGWVLAVLCLVVPPAIAAAAGDGPPVDAPGKPKDHMLVYESPAKVVAIPLEFEFKDVPLP